MGMDRQRRKLAQKYCEPHLQQHRHGNLKSNLAYLPIYSPTYGTIWHCPSVLKASYSSINHTIIHQKKENIQKKK
jgi:transposase